MKRRRKKIRNMPMRARKDPLRYRDVLSWWVPVMVLGCVISYFLFADLTHSGDEAGLNAWRQPTTRSITLGGGIFLMLLCFLIGAHELVRVYRHKRRKAGR